MCIGSLILCVTSHVSQCVSAAYYDESNASIFISCYYVCVAVRKQLIWIVFSVLRAAEKSYRRERTRWFYVYVFHSLAIELIKPCKIPRGPENNNSAVMLCCLANFTRRHSISTYAPTG